MTHPEDLFADYVDGALSDEERAVVDAHLATCAACREDVELARAAVAALSTLEEEPVPFGVTGPVLAEAGRRFERRRSALWSRVQWAAGAAAAAALVVLVAVNLDLGGRDGVDDSAAGGLTATTGATAAAGAESAPTMLGAVGLERQDANYDADGVRSLAGETARTQRERAAGATGDGGGGAADAFVAAVPPRVRTCLEGAQAPNDDPRNPLVRLIEAEYEDAPAYLAVFLESPGAGQPPDAVVVWVVSTTECQIVTAVQQAI
jgi:hypothetical protein